MEKRVQIEEIEEEKKDEEQKKKVEQKKKEEQKKKDERKKKNEIFTEDEIATLEEEVKKENLEIPKPREPKSVQLAFTEKIFPTLAMREQHLREAPLPKIKALASSSKTVKERSSCMKEKRERKWR